MRFNRTLFFFLSLILICLASSERRAGIFRRDLCTDNHQVDCESSCMPAGSVCCNDGSSTFCNAGSVCIPNGCCPVGQTCAGTGGTTTFADLTTGGSTIPTAAPSVSVLATTPAAQQATQSPGPTVDMQTTPVPSASASASTSTSAPAAHLSAQSSAAGTRAHLSTYSPASTNTSANSPHIPFKCQSGYTCYRRSCANLCCCRVGAPLYSLTKEGQEIRFSGAPISAATFSTNRFAPSSQ